MINISIKGERLHDFTISVGTVFNPATGSGDFKRCAYHPGGGIGLGGHKTLQCTNGLVGKYVRLQIEGQEGVDEILHVCEMLVYGIRTQGL